MILMTNRNHRAVVGVSKHANPSTDFPTTVIEAVAEARSVDPLDLPPLGLEVDFDALEILVDTMRERPVEIRFHAAGCLVVVDDTHVRASPESSL